MLHVALTGLETGLEVVAHNLVDNLANLRSAKYFLSLSFKLRLWETHGDNRRHTGQDVILLNAPILLCHLVTSLILIHLVANHLKQRSFKSLDVRAPLWSGNNIHKRTLRRVITNAPPKRNIDVAGAFNINWLQVPALVQALHSLVVNTLSGYVHRLCNRSINRQEIDEVNNSAIKLECFFDNLVTALINTRDSQAWNQERCLAGSTK